MKHFVAVLGLSLAMSFFSHAGTRDAAWKRVAEATQKGLPKTAIEELDPIIRGAIADRAWPEATKAIAQKINFQGAIEGNRPEERVIRLEAELGKVPREMVPLLETILAHWYWDYFRHNRWRFLHRTATAEAPGRDFTTWDLSRLFAEIDRHFQAALQAESFLQSTPIGLWGDLLPAGSLPDAYRPTLYDFVVHEALDFYTAGEQAGAQPEDTFVLSADSPVLDPADRFLGWVPEDPSARVTRPQSPPTRVSSGLRAIALYQALLRFHAADGERSAYLDADLARLIWARNTAVGEARVARVKAALQAFIDRNADHELAALALHHLAALTDEEGDRATARQLAVRAQQIHPNSAGAQLAANLQSEIEARSARITTELVWNRPWPSIQVHYRNVTNVWFRLVAWDWDAFLDRRQNRPENLGASERQQVLAKRPEYTWSHPLPASTNYQEQVVPVPVPSDLQPGFYFLIGSHNAEFAPADNQLSLCAVWVSELGLIVEPYHGGLQGLVIHAESGEPIEGARIQSWYLDRQRQRQPLADVTTDGQGRFRVRASADRGYLVKASYQGQQLATDREFHAWGPETREGPAEQSVLFTDRALYRPGQTIQYKGICLRLDQERNNYQTLAGKTVTLVFRDPNQKEIARQTVRANDFGSFSGSFTAPSGRLTGFMTIAVDGGPPGVVQVAVEEYKRPKFQVTLNAPATGARLNDRVQITGQATAYTGAAIDGAAVTYRVVREVRRPPWWFWSSWWRRPEWSNGASQEIAHGTIQTASDGTFQLEFFAKPDPRVPEREEPKFSYAVHVDVTEPAGETRSADRSVALGYTALEATLQAADWQTADRPVAIEIRTTTLDGEPQAAEGVVKVHALVPPSRVERAPLGGAISYGRYLPSDPTDESPSPGDPKDWPLGAVVFEQGFTSGTNGVTTLQAPLPEGAFRVQLETQDRFGKKVSGQLVVRVVQPAASKFALKIPHALTAPSWEMEPGQTFTALWGTGYDSGRAFIEIEHRGKTLRSYWTEPHRTQSEIRHLVDESLRGGFVLRVTFVRENRAYLETRMIAVPWRNKQLTLKWEHFTSKLQPGQKETWTAVISGPAGADSAPASPAAQAATLRAAAEMAATLYDASLDAFVPHDWPAGFDGFRQETARPTATFLNHWVHLNPFADQWHVRHTPVNLTYRAFPPDLISSGWLQPVMLMRTLAAAAVPQSAARGVEAFTNEMVMSDSLAERAEFTPPGAAAKILVSPEGLAGGAPTPARSPDLSQVAARRNLSETAFFFPHLLADTNGTVRLTFTLPEALTEWRFLGFAHTRALAAGLLEGRTVTAKELMVQPNPPRFLREGDVLEFTVKISNLSARRQEGKVRLTFNDGFTAQPVDAALNHKNPELKFDIPAAESRTFSWRLTVPDDLAVITYKAVAASQTVSDGEEGFIPVLARRILVTESLPLAVRGPGTRKFEFRRLDESGRSRTLKHQSLTVQMVSNPAWYAVLALPYLMEFPYECTEQTFNRFYANRLARLIAQSNPAIRRLFDQWKATATLTSPLQKNPELKGVLLDETPWVGDAQNETQARQSLGVLFDDNRLADELDRARQKLEEAQLPEGAWPWFPGGSGNTYITLYIATGFGRLRHLGADLNVDPALRALDHLDRWIHQTYLEIQEKHLSPGARHLTPLVALYLYGRSFYLPDKPIASEHLEAVRYFLDQAKRYWLSLEQRQSQAHVALALQRFGDPTAAREIVRSLKERSVTSEELGRYWRDEETSWWWFHAPVETQALMIEAFAEITADDEAVDGCQVWLLKQKQTRDWKTTKATADAAYALLLRGRDLLASTRLVEVVLGNLNVTPPSGPQAPPAGPARRSRSEASGRSAPSPVPTPAASGVEPGTGYYERRFAGSEVKRSMSQITVKKSDEGVAWGSVHWEYLEDISKVTAHADTPLKLTKTLYTKRNSLNGPVLEAVTGPVKVGDELVVRLVLNTDREMEFVHLKDQRGSGTEPVNVLSGWRYQEGLAYYESTRDTASHFFIDYLPRGTYVFEYSIRVQLRGEYPSGIASIQCLYAPEFNSHSGSTKLLVP